MGLIRKNKKRKNNEKIINHHTPNNQQQIITFEPRSYEEVRYAADHLKLQRSVVINLHRLNDQQTSKVKDFLSGVIYAIDGSFEKLGPKMYLFTPKSCTMRKHETN